MSFDGDSNVIEEKDYVLLKDLKVELNEESNGNGCSFRFCLWLYLTDPIAFPCTILHQVHPDTKHCVPFLLLNEEKKMMLFPVHYVHEEASSPDNPFRWREVSSASSEIEFPMNKWVHVGCEVLSDSVRLHIDGAVVGDKLLSSSPNRLQSNAPGSVSSLVIIGDESGLHSYVHNVEIMPLTSNFKSHYMKDPPPQLFIDYSTASEIEEDTDGVWSIVGGKASCRRIFSLDVTLLDAFGQPVNKDLEVFASIVYADNDAPVEKTIDEEAPLLASYDGIEFASSDRPSKLINARASFKLKISQLSSKCDSRLFRIKFEVPKLGGFSFLKSLSRPIRCISRSRNSKTSSLTWKKSPPRNHLPNGCSQSPSLDDGVSEALPNIIREARPSPSSKRVKLGHEMPFHKNKEDLITKRSDEECDSLAVPTSEVAVKTCLERRMESHDTWESVSSHSEDSEATNIVSNTMPNNKTPVSDIIVFKYCLGGLSERSLLLKEVAISAGEDELRNFADQVSQFSGCSHHRNQIIISKRLMEEGMKTWGLISQNNHHVLWENLIAGVREQFMKISFCSSRSLTHQDFELMRRIAGCHELVSQEHFERLWCWLYPVALTLSQERVIATWESVTPKWIEGFITKEEAEFSLQGPGGVRDPGTFVLRFPISRSWPHPDAGSLVVTYVGSDFMIHHRMLSRDLLCSYHTKDTMKPLHRMLLEVPELSRLGRVVRSF